MAASIYDLLKHDHEIIKPILAELAKGQMQQLNTMTTMLTAHLGAEETAFYKRLESSQETKDDIPKMYGAHQQATQVAAQLSSLQEQESEFRATAKTFEEAIGAHIVEEEGPLFSKAQKILSSAEAEAIGREFLQEEQRLMEAQKPI